MLSFTLLPSLGIKNDVSPDDPTMFEFITDVIARAHCVDSENISYDDSYVGFVGCANKAGGKTLIASLGVTMSGAILKGIIQNNFSLGASKNNVTYCAYSQNVSSTGLVYSYTSGASASIISDGAGSNFVELFGYMTMFDAFTVDYYTVMCDGLYGTTPYVIHGGAARKLIASGTEYVFAAIEYFKNRIFGGRYNSIHYSNLNPTLPKSGTASDVTFAAANQIYTPNDDSVVALRAMRNNVLYCYGINSISRINYLANYASPFSISIVSESFGTVEPRTIISAYDAHFGYDWSKGFYVFDGTNVKVISNKISGIVDDIKVAADSGYLYFMNGAHSERTREVCWTISTDGADNSYLLYYNYITGEWRKHTVAARAITSGYKLDTDGKKVVLMGTDIIGDLYYAGLNTTENGNAYSGYRTEPILNFGNGNKSLLLEIWFSLAVDIDTTSTAISVYYRGGDTVGEVQGESFVAFSSTVSVVNPTLAVCYINKLNRYHQIKWGDLNSNNTFLPFSVRSVEFKYVPQGRY